jgi:hypothetical protein
MAKDPNPGLFQRLSQLFRSGPVIKRTVKNYKEDQGKNGTLSAYELFRKNHSSVYSSAMSAYGTYDRLARYSDFSEMDYTPEINSALDIYAEEVASPGVDGQILSIYSENKDVERLLNELFFDTLNVNFNLTAWVRNLCKYGDFCLFNDVHPGHGVLNVIPIPVNELEREENYDPKDPMAVRYRWVTQGNTVLENWQVTHFRLLGNDAFLPYGSSVLEGARRVWRQMVLAEDAMLVYRVVRSPDRRVFYIDVGNVPPEEVPMYMEQAQASLKKSQVVDKSTGRVDMRYNPMSVDEDYFIPVRGGESGTKIDTLSGGTNAAAIEDVQYIQKKLFAALKIPKAYLGYDESIGCFAGDTRIALLSGRTATIEELAHEYDTGTQRGDWVYSSTPEGDFRAGRIVKAWRTKDVSELIEVGLDDGSSLRCTGNHLFMLRDGSYRRADQLTPGSSLMPLYRKLSSRRAGDFADGYERIFDNRTGEWIYTHQSIARQGLVQDHESCSSEKHHVVHHVSYDKLNNSPDMLLRMGKNAHARHHAENAANITSPSSRENLRAVMRTEDYRAKHATSLRHAWQGDMSHERRKLLRDSNLRHKKIEKMHVSLQKLRAEGKLIFVSPHLKPVPAADDIRRLIAGGVWRKEDVRRSLNCSHLGLDRAVKEMGSGDWFSLVSAVRPDLRIPGSRVWSLDLERHSQIASACRTRREFLSRVDVSRCGFENFLRRKGIAPSSWYEQNLNKGNHSVVYIKTVRLENPTPVYDIEVEGWSNFTVLAGGSAGEPASGVVVHNSKATLSQEDIRFSRTIARIQRTVIAELNKLAIIHLYSNGFDGDDLLDFTLQLPNPSTIAQQQKLELYGTRFDIVSKAPDGYFDKRWLRKNLLGLTDEEIEEIEEGRIKDKLRELELEKVQAESEGGGVADEPSEPTGGEIGAGPPGGEVNPADLPMTTDTSAPPPSAPPEGGGGEAPPSAPPAAGGGPESGPAPLDELDVFKIDDEDAPVRAQSRIDRTVRHAGEVPVMLSERKARPRKPDETPEQYKAWMDYNRKRRKPMGNMRVSVDHNELTKHDKGDDRDAITHPHGTKSDISPSLKDLTPGLDENQDINEVVNRYTTTATNEIETTLRSLRAGLPKRREDKE